MWDSSDSHGHSLAVGLSHVFRVIDIKKSFHQPWERQAALSVSKRVTREKIQTPEGDDRLAMKEIWKSKGGNRGAATKIPTPKGDEPTLIIDVNPFHRVPLVFFNLLIFALSFMVAFVSLVSMVERSNEISFRNRSFLVSVMVNMDVTAFFISGAVVVASFLGFMGALRENVCFLQWYLNVLLGLEVLCTIMAFAGFFVPFISTGSAQSLFSIDMIVSYRDNPDYARLVDTAQASFQCCGVTSERYHDWNHNIYFRCSKSNPSTERCSVPASCCRPLEGENPDLETRLKRRFCGSGVLVVTEQEAWQKIYTRNCVDATIAYIRANTFVLIGVSMVLMAVLAVLARAATRVHDEVISLTRLYDEYYQKREAGYRRSLAQMEALDEVRATHDDLVGKKEPKRLLSPGSTLAPKLTQGEVTSERRLETVAAVRPHDRPTIHRPWGRDTWATNTIPLPTAMATDIRAPRHQAHIRVPRR
ncbi:hypothetical protein MTO96_023174, partial [Rhipicephalus appendiculatus]